MNAETEFEHQNLKENAKANPFFIPSIFDKLIHFAPKQELYSFRQLSTNFCQSISKLYFDQLNLSIVINPREKIGPWKFLVSLSDPAVLHIFRQVIIKDLDFMDSASGAYGQNVIDFLRHIGQHQHGHIKIVEIWIDYYRTVCGLNYRVKNNSNLIEPFLMDVAGYFTKLETLNIQQV